MNLSIRRACLMGHPVAHSRSPMIHGHWLRTLGIAGGYHLEDVEPARFAPFLTQLSAHGYVGGNVTVPHKESAFRLVARRDRAAEAVGAVNTVWFENGVLVGGNSDVHGFVTNLDEHAPGWHAPGRHAVILGAGGAARAATYGLLHRGVTVSLANRTLERARHLAEYFGEGVDAHGFESLPELLPSADLLVNCTVLGMIGEPRLDVDLALLKPDAVVCDAVYVPLETELLATAARRGHRTVDGLGMLLHQAGFGFEKWFGVRPKVTRDLRELVEADLHAKIRQR
jgi:shikimate dehydrogenase